MFKTEKQIATEKILQDIIEPIYDYISRIKRGIGANDSDEEIEPDSYYFHHRLGGEQGDRCLEIARLCYYNIRKELREREKRKKSIEQS